MSGVVAATSPPLRTTYHVGVITVRSLGMQAGTVDGKPAACQLSASAVGWHTTLNIQLNLLNAQTVKVSIQSPPKHATNTYLKMPDRA